MDNRRASSASLAGKIERAIACKYGMDIDTHVARKRAGGSHGFVVGIGPLATIMFKNNKQGHDALQERGRD